LAIEQATLDSCVRDATQTISPTKPVALGRHEVEPGRRAAGAAGGRTEHDASQIAVTAFEWLL
jgi:hypothetical protein